MVSPAPLLHLAQGPLEERIRQLVGAKLARPILERIVSAAAPPERRRAASRNERLASVLRGVARILEASTLHAGARRPLEELDALFRGDTDAEDAVALELVPPTDDLFDELLGWLELVPGERTATSRLRQIGLARGLDWQHAENLLATEIEQHLLTPHERTRTLAAFEAVMCVCALADACFLAIVHGAWTALHRDLHRPFIALDAGRTHHTILGRWRDLPKTGTMRTTAREGFAEIFTPNANHNVALRLKVHEIPMHLIEAIRHWRSWHGLRHWAALQYLLTHAGRTGRIRWNLHDHMEALGLSERARREPHIRRKIAHEVEALTRLEVAVYNPDGTLRVRGPILTVTQRGEALRGSEWALEGLELVIHPVLYEGVRKASGGIGTLWAPAPIELAHLDERTHPHALALGLILPIRWRWDQGDDPQDYLVLTGEKLLETAGIRQTPHNPGRCWQTLDHNLAALQAIGGVGQVVWEPDEKHSLAGRCRLYPPTWVRDRLVHHLQPLEEAPKASLLTGSDLIKWRRWVELTQAELANQIGLSERTLRRAETNPDQPLTATVRGALERFRKAKLPPSTAT